ncbi:MAG TPA: AarF/ABC1/UbiB kinase family protein [Verrucomicrobiae bacterium]|nr:AarF/ABC1/UbiB kinase family protein [Verrucomicrobiae bacterium]
MKTDLTTGVLARGYRMGKLGFSLVGSYLGYQAQNLLLSKETRPQRHARLHKDVSRRVRDELGELKGPVMKLGQMLSMQTDFLSDEVLEELAGLQMQAPPMHATLARAQFKSALGKYPEEAFREFDPEPFAAASLGQVHRAITFDGEKVAVKIQYPAIRSAIENDLKLLRSATLPTRVTGHVPPALLDEIARGLLEETDYLHEAGNIDYFRKGLAGLSFVTVPHVYRELTSDRVLTMSFVEGESLNNWLKRKPSHALRDLMGARLTEAYETQLQHLRVIHADQHPGNYLFQPDGRFGLVDFGCVKRVNFGILELHRFYETRGWQENEAAAHRFLSIIYGNNVPFARARKILPILEEFLDILWPRGSDFVIDFKTFKNPRVNEIRRKFLRQTVQDKLVNPDFVYLVRGDMGFWHLISEIGATVNLSEITGLVSATVPPMR